jgi:hypothetical protein
MSLRGGCVSFSEVVRLLQARESHLVREMGSVRYYGTDGWPILFRVDYHGPRLVPTATLPALLQTGGIDRS